ncbi:hypothetical protein QAD02_003579 [Eretmocerus hayati]|uniref:Uncharacterized protein n=1 Tax=Eretmocerus hayati TaxID=131215 RepID=A0ACC2NMC3_9HYME|nr:hypothetical protein QAD02_003579 [Eretmocerus hayati]
MEVLKNKDIGSLLNILKYVRISNFVTPLFFYVELLDEDIIYNRLELELLDFHGSENLDDQLSTIWSGLRGAVLKKLNSKELKLRMMVTTDINSRWLRYEVLHSKFCKCVDDGRHRTLSLSNFVNGVYELSSRLTSTSPRAVLCGLGPVLPKSRHGCFWSLRASGLFKIVAEGRDLCV